MINESKPFLHLWMRSYCSEKVSQVGGVSFLTWKIKVFPSFIWGNSHIKKTGVLTVGDLGEGPEGPGPLIMGKKEEMTEARKASRGSK